MIFNQSKVPNSINIPFNWVADYYSGNSISEYDFMTHQPNSFYSIKQHEVFRFGLIGNGMKFYFEMTDGSFYLNGRRLDIAYIDDSGHPYNLTSNQNKKDLITYKQAFTDLSKSQGVQRSNLESINFGYKTLIKDSDIQLSFQPIVCIPFNSTVYLQIKLTSNRSLNGYIVFYVSGKERDRFKAPLEANNSGVINWTVK